MATTTQQTDYGVRLPQRRNARRRSRVKNEDIEIICNAHLEGYLPWEIDEALGLTAGTAERVLDEEGYKPKLRIPRSEYEQYPRLYMVERMSLQAIAEKFSTRNRRRSAGTVKVYLLTLGTYIDEDGKKRKIRIRHAGHKGKAGKTRSRKRQVH